MTTSVYHAGLGAALNLTEPDLGQPSMPGLWETLRADKRPVPERQLQCMECMQSRPHCPEWMFLTERNGARFASHFNRSIKDHPSNESDQHKALKERIARAAENGGHKVVIEDRAKHGKRRTDVLVKGPGGLIVGHEVQLSYLRAAPARKRADIAHADGVLPLWTGVDPAAQWINHVPWARTDDMSWRLIANGRELLVRGGARTLSMTLCDWNNPDPCPARGRGRCGKRHGKWELAHPQLDDLVRATAEGTYVPIIIPQGKRRNRMWVPSQDRDTYLDSGGILLTEENLKTRREEEQAETAPRPLDPQCRYGQDSGHRAPPATIRDDGAPVEVSLTVQAPARPASKLFGPCGYGPGPCGATPTRPYACGPRCASRAPGVAEGRRP